MVGLLLSSLAMDIEIKRAINAVRTDLEANLGEKIREEGIATRRHLDVVSESLRDDIRIIAEGLISLDAKVERMRST